MILKQPRWIKKIILLFLIFLPSVIASSVERNFESNVVEAGKEFTITYIPNPLNPLYFAVDELVPMGFSVKESDVVQGHLRFFSTLQTKKYTLIAPSTLGDYTFSGGQYQVYGDDNWYYFQPKTILIIPECIDNDNDGYGAGCVFGYDCNDENKEINPNATEICDEKDNNCNGLIDDNGVCEIKLVVNSPKDGVFNSKKIIFDILLNQEVEELSYIDYSDVRQKQQNLCKKCKEYGNNQIKTKNFKDGVHNIVFMANKYGGYEEKSVSIFIDNKEPKIKKSFPKKKKYGNGSFIIEYQEDNVKQIILNYGNNILGKSDCPFNNEERTQMCEFYVDLGEFNNKSLIYSFEIEDIAGNTVRSKETEIFVDLTKPVINKLDYYVEGRKVNFDIKVSEKVDLEYYDENDRRPRWKNLCRKCDNYDRSKSFSPGEHDLVIRATDKGLNIDEMEINFII